MLVVCMGDGLGNQLFQYAFYLQLKKNYPNNIVLVDICNYYGSVNEHNGYELERIFGLKLPECSEWEARVLADYNYNARKKHRIISQLFKLRSIVCGPKSTYLVQDDPTVYYEEFFKLSEIKSYMLRGNWINEKYFDGVRQELLDSLVFPDIIDEANISILDEIEKTNSVSIHIRRGDYVGSGMESLDVRFYEKALDKIKSLIGVSELKLFVFSDDPQYVKNNFKELQNAVFVTNNSGVNSFRDMQLMSKCKYNIIANSTFSFWGAYLNQYSEKIVIAPRKAANIYRNPFACSDWILV